MLLPSEPPRKSPITARSYFKIFLCGIILRGGEEWKWENTDYRKTGWDQLPVVPGARETVPESSLGFKSSVV